MADNRVFIRCKGCGEELFLGKFYRDVGWYNPFGSCNIDNFLMHHSECFMGLDEKACGGLSFYDDKFEPFELVYENNDNWGKLKSFQDIQKEIDNL